jgi:hypothetical protein
MSGSFCHGPGGCNDSCYICLAPLGPGQADDAQIANALLTGAVVCLAPGDWLINGAVVTYTQAQELHGHAAPLALAKARAGTEAFCTDETGGAVPVFSDGTDWRRVTDRAIIS